MPLAGFTLVECMVATALMAIVGGVISHRKEQKSLRKKSERIRRQLQRMLDTSPDKP